MLNLTFLYGKMIAQIELHHNDSVEILGNLVFANDFVEWELKLINEVPYIEKRSLESNSIPVERLSLVYCGTDESVYYICYCMGLVGVFSN